MTTAAARSRGAESSHWYYQTGEPCYELPKKDGSGMKVPTLADARKLNLVPSVTTILKCLHKQALVDWLIEQAVLAVLTTPRLPSESDDAFVQRVLHTERVQDQESQTARDRGTQIHAAMEDLFAGREIAPELQPWVLPPFQAISARGRPLAVEYIVVGEGYAGKLDLAQDEQGVVWLCDWKTAKKLPDPAKGGAWSDHRLQLSAYGAAYPHVHRDQIRTGNVYISTLVPGQFVICEHDANWLTVFEEGFAPLVKHWQWANNYRP